LPVPRRLRKASPRSSRRMACRGRESRAVAHQR
jgi:hypothetical protein